MKCSREGCDNQIDLDKGQIQYYCSKVCRLLGRGSKKAKKVAKRIMERGQ